MSTEIALPPKFRTIQEWTAGLNWLVNFKRNWQWLFGTYLLKGEERYGDEIWNHIHFDEIPYDQGYLTNIMSVCRRIGDQYTPEIKEWTFWEAMAPMTPKQRDPIITRALAGDIDRDEIRALRAAARNGGAVGHGDRVAMASDSTGTPGIAIPARLDLSLDEFGTAAALSVKLAVRKRRGEPCDSLLADALDDLIAKAMDLRGRLESQ